MGFPRRYRWVLAVAGAFGLLAALLLVLAYTGSEGRYTRAQYDRIRLGMTRAEVQAILGPAKPDSNPPKSSTGDGWVSDAEEGKLPPHGDFLLPEDLPPTREWWADDKGAIAVNYIEGEERRVAWKGRLLPYREPFWQRLRRQLGL
jgi:hypothetical protein